MSKPSELIDDLRHEAPITTIGTCWRLVSDQVMGGVSEGSMTRELVAGRPANRMRGSVRTENNGGFLQMALDLAPGGADVDATAWLGIELDVFGNDQEYAMHLRTTNLSKPWQSYRQNFGAPHQWQTIRLSFDRFVPHRTDIPLDLTLLRRIGIVAIGRAFRADLALGGIRFFN